MRVENWRFSGPGASATMVLPRREFSYKILAVVCRITGGGLSTNAGARLEIADGNNLPIYRAVSPVNMATWTGTPVVVNFSPAPGAASTNSQLDVNADGSPTIFVPIMDELWVLPQNQVTLTMRGFTTGGSGSDDFFVDTALIIARK